MALLEKIEQYNPEEEWPYYVERVKQFFKANDHTVGVKADKWLATFHLVIGSVPNKYYY